ncbi:MAG: hypothetical protein H8E27_03315 [Verrucomicrobia subdivision 3 bacterium]|nr:hypothetical protein [Limisphaerales bacterium]
MFAHIISIALTLAGTFNTLEEREMAMQSAKATILFDIECRKIVDHFSLFDNVQYPSITDAMWTQDDWTILHTHNELLDTFQHIFKEDPALHDHILLKIDRCFRQAFLIKEHRNRQRALAGKKPLDSFANENSIRMKRRLRPIGGYVIGYRPDPFIESLFKIELIDIMLKRGVINDPKDIKVIIVP